MGLFGGGGRRERDALELRTELERLERLSLDDLAAEVLLRVFGEGGQMRDDGTVPFWRVTMPFDPRGTGLFPGMPREVRDGFRDLVEEGIGRLESRDLVFRRITGRDQTDVDLRLTRAGRRALAAGGLGEPSAGAEPD
jgi:hypothetical protein